jgi:cytosine/adenosine deaminase-related metal-dependent hydrolase
MRILINARNRSVAIEGDSIVSEGGRFDIVIDRPKSGVRPGLINAHDHLHRNHYGRLGSGPYRNAYRWAEDIQLRFARRIKRGRRVSRREALLAGAWKNLFAGVSTVVHHDAWEPDFDDDFPIRVARVESADSLGMEDCLGHSSGAPFCLHVAEGIDDVAAGELGELEARGLLDRSLIAVHGVAIGGADVDRFRKSGAALTWCPTSNNFLFGRSVSKELLECGCDLLLGSDSRLTAEGDLLDEMRAASGTKLVDNQRLENAVGRIAAGRLGLPEPSLEPGNRADLILIDEPLSRASANDIALTVVDGIPRVASPDVARDLGPLLACGTQMRVGRVTRWANQQGRKVS